MTLNQSTLELMKELTEIIGVPGNEKNISRVLQAHYLKYTDEVVFDNLGSVFAVKKCGKENAKRVMICGHMDEAGFIIKGRNENGLLSILPLGTLHNQSLLGQRVKVMNRLGGIYKGTIVSEQDDNKQLDCNHLLVDVGATSIEELEELPIQLGDSLTFDSDFTLLLEGKRILSKAWNGRYGCVMGIELLALLEHVQLEVDLYIGCTVQEEVGLRGAQTATHLVRPDLAIVLDCLPANDYKNGKDPQGKLGEGILVTYYDKTMMPNRTLLQHLITTCREHEIGYQYYYSLGDGDAGWIHKLRTGCPSLTANICARNINTASSIIDSNDYLQAQQALVKIIHSLTPELIDEMKIENR